MERRALLRAMAGAGAGAGAAVAVALSGSVWREALAHTTVSVGTSGQADPGAGRHGALLAPDANGVRLPKGSRSRVVARSGQPVAGSGVPWHDAPDGGACFRGPASGWT